MLACIGEGKLINTDLIARVNILADGKDTWEIVVEVKSKEIISVFSSKSKEEVERKFKEYLVELKELGCLIHLNG